MTSDWPKNVHALTVVGIIITIFQRNAISTPRLFLTGARFLTPTGVLLLALCLIPALVLAQGETRIIFEQNEVRIRAPALSPDGGYVAFTIDKNERWLFNRETQSLELLFTTADLTGDFFNVSDRGLGASVSNEARFHPFWSDGNNGYRQVYLFDRDSGTFELVSRTPTGEEGNGRSNRAVVTPDGRFVAFISRADNMVPDVNPSSNNIYLYDRTDSSVTLISRNLDGTPDDSSDENVDISDDGSRILFNSYGTKLVANDNNEKYHDVYLYDAAVGAIARINEPGGEQSDDANAHRELSISGDGQSVIWADSDKTLDPAKTSLFKYQLFLKELPSGAISMASRSVDGNEPNNGLPSGGNPPLGISASGRFLFFQHYATDLIDNDETGGRADIFVLDRRIDEITVASIDENGDQVGPTSDNRDRPSLSGDFNVSNDGRFLVFVGRRHDSPTDILYLRDRGDVVAPVISDLATMPADPTPDVQVEIQAQAVDLPSDLDSHILNAEYRIDGGEWLPMNPVDGAYDSGDEQVSVTLDAGILGLGSHQVCVRATDEFLNVSAPECITVEEVCDDEIDGDCLGSRVGLKARCWHEPLYPTIPGETVTITADAIDQDGVSVPTNVLEIWLNDRESPAIQVNGQESVELTFTADWEFFRYGCFARRDTHEDFSPEDYFSGWRLVDVGDPLLPFLPAVPIALHGPINEKIDIVFFPDQDDYTGPGDGNFHDDVGELIRDGLFTIPWFVEFQDIFNFWIANRSAIAGPDPDADNPSTDLCLREEPKKFKKTYSFADAGGIVHVRACRDNAGKPGVFTIQVGINPQVLAHEMGHRPFGLKDEYCCDGGYGRNNPFPNLYKTEAGCRNGASERGWNPDDCRGVDEDRPFPKNRTWWIFEPDFRAAGVGDLMQQSGQYRLNASEFDRMTWMLGNCLKGDC